MSDPIPRLNAALSGRYHIERELGEGGMATVYLAHDAKHGRRVALKVLKPELAAVVGAERFLAEITTTANLQHPHILPLHDSGEADGFLYYVMPYVEGESLRERLARERQLPVDEAVAIAVKVAGALQAAHEHGVIHRDIKPGNILLARGEPLIADFGIALAVGTAGGGRLTETGLSLGTPSYMSPEQATGDRTIGSPADTYALGCVLYEMLVGEPPFTGRTAQAILGRIITGDVPSATGHRPSVPAHVDAAVRRALEKLPADRFASARDFAGALGDPGFRHGERVEAAAAVPTYPTRTVAALAATTALFAALAVWLWTGRAPQDLASEPVSRLTISLSGDHRLALANMESMPLAISPDGRTVAYVGESIERTQLYVRHLGAFDPVALPGTDEARQPFFSPDGEQIAYFTRRGLFRVPVSGGPPLRIAPIPVDSAAGAPIIPAGGAWGGDDVIVIAADGAELWSVAAAGGEPEAIPITWTEPPTGGAPPSPESRIRWPSFLPSAGDEVRLLASISSELAVVTLPEGAATFLGVRLTGHGMYVDPGHIVFTLSSGEALSVPFDLETLEAGTPSPEFSDVFRPGATFAGLLAASRSGTVVYVPGGSERTVELVDRRGFAERLPLEPNDYRFAVFSPDGRRLAIDARSGGITVLDLATRAPTEVVGSAPSSFSPDGTELAFGSPPRRVGLSPAAVPARFEGMPDGMYAGDWGSDGRLILIKPPQRDSTSAGVYIGTIGSDAPVEVVVDTEFYEAQPKRSPDGRFVAYMSDASGRSEVYVQELDAPDNLARVSFNGGAQPIWSRTGGELFFWKMEQAYSARLLATDPLELSAPEPMFRGRYFLQTVTQWDVSPSGEFALISPGPNFLREILVIESFVEELEARATR